jgi:hypothetical protein
MQTFMTHADPAVCAQHLDRNRLNKQITEALQIIRANLDPNYGWRNHPAVRQWQGHEHYLAEYTLAMIDEWQARGFDSHHGSKYHAINFAATLPDTGPPQWWGRPDIITSHQSNLVRKNPDHYWPLFPLVPEDLDYIWPTKESQWSS